MLEASKDLRVWARKLIDPSLIAWYLPKIITLPLALQTRLYRYLPGILRSLAQHYSNFIKLSPFTLHFLPPRSPLLIPPTTFTASKSRKLWNKRLNNTTLKTLNSKYRSALNVQLKTKEWIKSCIASHCVSHMFTITWFFILLGTWTVQHHSWTSSCHRVRSSFLSLIAVTYTYCCSFYLNSIFCRVTYFGVALSTLWGAWMPQPFLVKALHYNNCPVSCFTWRFSW